MSKTMTKYQLDHYKQKVKRQFDPMIDEQELLVKQYKTEATDKAVDKLSKKIGADKIINQFRQAEKKLEEARASALRSDRNCSPLHRGSGRQDSCGRACIYRADSTGR